MQPEALDSILNAPSFVPGEATLGPDWIKLNTNENPYPPSPAVHKAIEVVLKKNQLRSYPLADWVELKSEIAKRHGVPASWILLGNGSQEIVTMIARAYIGPGRLGVYHIPGYPLYESAIALSGGIPQPITVEAETLRSGLIPTLSSQAAVNFVVNPHSPTGVSWSTERLKATVASACSLVVVDEAYQPFSETPSAVEWISDNPHLIILRTLSKSHSLAGLRVGYAVASPGIIGVLERVRECYNVNRLSAAAAIVALKDEVYFQSIRSKIIQSRDIFAEQLKTWGWETFPSMANFVYFSPHKINQKNSVEAAQSAFKALRDQKILIRHFIQPNWACTFLRISIGLPQDMDYLTAVLDNWRQS